MIEADEHFPKIDNKIKIVKKLKFMLKIFMPQLLSTTKKKDRKLKALNKFTFFRSENH